MAGTLVVTSLHCAQDLHITTGHIKTYMVQRTHFGNYLDQVRKMENMYTQETVWELWWTQQRVNSHLLWVVWILVLHMMGFHWTSLWCLVLFLAINVILWNSSFKQLFQKKSFEINYFFCCWEKLSKHQTYSFLLSCQVFEISFPLFFVFVVYDECQIERGFRRVAFGKWYYLFFVFIDFSAALHLFMLLFCSEWPEKVVIALTSFC